jgi:TolA-binding protein
MLVAFVMPAGCFIRPSWNGGLTGPESEYQDALNRVKEKKYQEALSICRKIASDSPQSPVAADAFYETAYLLVFYDNPQKDYNQALSGFDEFLKRYPDHAKAEDARNWRGVLKTILDARKENEHLIKNIEQLKKLDIRHEERRGK